jgi:hypothetical protein
MPLHRYTGIGTFLPHLLNIAKSEQMCYTEACQ